MPLWSIVDFIQVVDVLPFKFGSRSSLLANSYLIIYNLQILLNLLTSLLVSYLCYSCLFAHSGVHHILCCVFVVFVFLW
jgi:hypothetical protein